MKRLLLSVAAVALLSPTAHATDLMNSPPVQDEVASPLYEWSGFYIGGFGGWAWSQVDATELSAGSAGFYNFPGRPYNFDVDGFTGGGQIGFDWQRNRLVYGVGAETGVIDLDGKTVDPNSVPFAGSDTKTSFESDWYGAVTGRVGIAFDRVLVFARGGVAFLDAEAKTVDNCTAGACGNALINAKDDDVLVGWTAGGGASIALGSNWALGAEYRLFNFDDGLKPTGTSNFGFRNTQRVESDDIHTVRLAIDYRW